MSADIVQIRDYQGPAINYGVHHEEPARVIILPAVRARLLTTLQQKMEALRRLQAVERGD